MDIFFLTRWTWPGLLWVSPPCKRRPRDGKVGIILVGLVEFDKYWVSVSVFDNKIQTSIPIMRQVALSKVGWQCRSPPATRKMASSANWTSNLETPSPWRPTARWWWCGTPRRTPRGGRRTPTWPRLRSLRTPTLPFCWHLCEMTKNTYTYPSSLHITESQLFKAKCQMPNHRSSLL